MSISRKTLVRVLPEADIVKVIRTVLGAQSIRQRRNNKAEYIGLCPFHYEKTPSFTVTAIKQFYHCFGCGAHGNAVAFVVEREGLDYLQAVIKVAEISGIPVASGKTKLSRARRRNRKGAKTKVFTRKTRKCLPNGERPVVVRETQEFFRSGDVLSVDGEIPF